MDNKYKYPSDEEAKKIIIEIGKRIYFKNFVAANDGNISCKVSDDTLWTTPTGVSKGFMDEKMLIKTDISGKILESKGYEPSSELKMHLRIYLENSEAKAVVHAHPPIATSFAIAGLSLDEPFLPEAIVQLGVVPCLPFAMPGTDEVPESLAPYCNEYNAVLLGNHGAVTWGTSIMQAYMRMEVLEYYANIIMNNKYIIRKANKLRESEIEHLVEIRTRMGVTSGGYPKSDER